MRILFAHEINYETKVIYEVQEYPELLAERGHEIVFLQFEEGANFKLGLKGRDRKIKGRVKENVELRLVTPHRFGFEKIDRIWTVFSSIFTISRLLKESKFDLIVNYAVPTFGFQLLTLSRLHKVPFVHRALDASHVIRESFWNPFIRIAEKFIYKNSKNLSANNPALARYCSEFSGRKSAVSTELPPLELLPFRAARHDALLANSLGIMPKDKVIMYMGSFFYFSGLAQVIRDFARETQNQKNLKLLLIGGGEQDKELRELVAQLEVGDSVVFTGIIPFSELANYLKLGHVAINSMEKLLVSDVAFPHKVIQYMATGIPVVTTKLDGLQMTFGDEAGITWAQSPSEIIDESLRLLNSSESHLQFLRDKQLAAVSRFSHETATDVFESLLITSSSELGKKEKKEGASGEII
jgi:glycosyltransferase involved in cell wall biosynthesis